MRATLFILFTVFSMSIPAQEYFNERIELSHPLVFDAAINCLEVDDGYIVNGVTGHSLNPFWHQRAKTKLDFMGEVLWKKTWGDTISRWYFADTESLQMVHNCFYSFGTKSTYYESGSFVEILMIKYNANFDSLWSHSFSEKSQPFDTTYSARNFISIENGFAVVGTLTTDFGSYHEPYLLIVDSLGNIEHEYSYPDSGYYFQGKSIIQTNDGGYAIGAYKHIIGNYGAAIGDPIVIKTDSLGNKEWELNLGGPYQDGSAILCNSDDGDIIAVSRYDIDSLDFNKYLSRVQLTKIDNEGNILWNKPYGDKALWTAPANIRTDSAGGYIISGVIGDNNWPVEPSYMGFMLRINSEDDSLWYRKYAVLYDKSSLNLLFDAIPTSDGGFLGAGRCIPVGSDTGTQDAWVIKIDSLGCTSPTDCWVGEQEINIQETENELLIYPNPASEKFTVASQQSPVSSWRVEVYDLFGIKVEEILVPKGQTELVVNAVGWQKGLYVVSVINKKGMLGSGKVMIR